MDESGLPWINVAQLGPSEGDHFPEVRLPNQHGELVDLHHRRAGRRALVIFYRSADW